MRCPVCCMARDSSGRGPCLHRQECSKAHEVPLSMEAVPWRASLKLHRPVWRFPCRSRTRQASAHSGCRKLGRHAMRSLRQGHWGNPVLRVSRGRLVVQSVRHCTPRPRAFGGRWLTGFARSNRPDATAAAAASTGLKVTNGGGPPGHRAERQLIAEPLTETMHPLPTASGGSGKIRNPPGPPPGGVPDHIARPVPTCRTCTLPSVRL